MKDYIDEAMQLIKYIYSDVNVLNLVLQGMRRFLVGRDKTNDTIMEAWMSAADDITYDLFRDQSFDDRTDIKLKAATILMDPSHKNKCQLFDAEYLCTDNTLTAVEDSTEAEMKIIEEFLENTELGKRLRAMSGLFGGTGGWYF